MPGPKGNLPQWWLDHTPHDTLEEQLERKKKEEAEKKEQEIPPNEQICNSIISPAGSDEAVAQEQTLTESQGMNVTVNGNVKALPLLGSNSYSKGAPRSIAIGPDEYESTDYNLERARLKHVENGISQRNRKRHSANSKESIHLKSPPEQDLTIQTAAMDTSPQGQSPNSGVTSPFSPKLSTGSTTPSSPSTTTRKPRHFKTAFTGVSSFDFAMQQRAREQERREKERLARESLARHHADRVEVDRAHEQRALLQEEKRKKKEAQENLKGFKKVSLESAMDKSSELKRQQLEQKRKKKEAEEQHHVYKSTS